MDLGVCCSYMLPNAVEKRSIMHGHSTREDFQNSFIGSNLFAPLFGKYLAHMYKKADFIITPSEYSKQLIQSYGVKTRLSLFPMGLICPNTKKIPKKKRFFGNTSRFRKDRRSYFVPGLYFRRKGLRTLLRWLVECQISALFG